MGGNPARREPERAQFFHGLAEVFDRYIVFPRELRRAEITALTLWVEHTWAFDASEVTPYMAILGPTMRSGKSRVIDVCQHLVRNSWVVVEPSAAALVRKIDREQPTVFIDEADQLERSKDLRGVLNAGYKREGGTRTVNIQVAGEWVPWDFNVYAPKMFCGIVGKRIPLAGTVLDRCVRLPIERRLPTEPVLDFFHSDFGRSSGQAKEVLFTFAELHMDELKEARPEMPSLGDRVQECWLPLVAIADVIGGSWPELAREAMVTLTEAIDEEPDEGVQILADLKTVWNGVRGEDGNWVVEPIIGADREPDPGDKAHTVDLANARNQLEDPHYHGHLTGQELALRLKRFGIKPERNSIRIGGHSRRGYKRASFEEAWKRYVGDDSATPKTATASGEPTSTKKKTAAKKTSGQRKRGQQ